MRVAKHQVRGKPTQNYYLFFADHLGRRERKLPLPMSLGKQQAESVARNVQSLVACRIAGEQPDPKLTRWLENIPADMRDRLVNLGLLDASRAAAGKSLASHIDDFRHYLERRERTGKNVSLTIQRIKAVVDGCKFGVWSDITASRVDAVLGDMRAGGLSKVSSNHYLKAVKFFCRWMVLNRRASENPVESLRPLSVPKGEEVHSRVNLTVDEVKSLLAAVADGPESYGMDGRERALLYQFAIETGLRANAIRSLTVGSIDFQQSSVRLRDRDSKNREEVVVPLREAMLTRLREFTSNKLPGVKLFGGRYSALTDRTSDMLRKDYLLVAEPILYRDPYGRHRDFHSLRHTGYTWMESQGVPRNIIARIFGHKTLSMGDTYSHPDWQAMRAAVAKLPDVTPDTKVAAAEVA